MGADMLIASIGFRTGRTQAQTNRNIKSTLLAVRKEIQAVKSLDDLDADYADFHLDCDKNEVDEARLDEIRKELLSDLKEVEYGALGSHRQAAMVPSGNGIVLLVSGGLSWGDEPCELFTSINRLQSAGVIHDVRFTEPTERKRRAKSKAS